MARVGEVLAALEALAPLRLAASWDNVGLLVEGRREVRRVWCTIDLTEPVLDEALAAGADLVVSYHPPIFGGLRRVTRATPTERIVSRLLQEGLHVYSPHTALDAVPGGLNDWLLEGFGPVDDVAPIEAADDPPPAGLGRTARLVTPRPLPDLLASLKAHLGLQAFRLAAPPDLRDGARPVAGVAVCPGAGGSVFEGVRGVDLLLTGEMRHHDVLARVGSGVAVILTDHTHTERGYLPRFARALAQLTGLDVGVSDLDDDPLRVV